MRIISHGDDFFRVHAAGCYVLAKDWYANGFLKYSLSAFFSRRDRSRKMVSSDYSVGEHDPTAREPKVVTVDCAGRSPCVTVQNERIFSATSLT